MKWNHKVWNAQGRNQNSMEIGELVAVHSGIALSAKDTCYAAILAVLEHAAIEFAVTLYFKVSLLQCNYTFKYWVILINYMYLLYG